MRKWQCRKRFELTSGELSVAAESNLTKRRVRRTKFPGVYVFDCDVETELVSDADQQAYDRLAGLLQPYGVTFDVIEAENRFVNWKPADASVCPRCGGATKYRRLVNDHPCAHTFHGLESADW